MLQRKSPAEKLLGAAPRGRMHDLSLWSKFHCKVARDPCWLVHHSVSDVGAAASDLTLLLQELQTAARLVSSFSSHLLYLHLLLVYPSPPGGLGGRRHSGTRKRRSPATSTDEGCGGGAFAAAADAAGPRPKRSILEIFTLQGSPYSAGFGLVGVNVKKFLRLRRAAG